MHVTVNKQQLLLTVTCIHHFISYCDICMLFVHIIHGIPYYNIIHYIMAYSFSKRVIGICGVSLFGGMERWNGIVEWNGGLAE